MSRTELYLTIIAFVLLMASAFRLTQLVILKIKAGKLKRKLEALERVTLEQIKKQAEIDRLLAEDIARIAGQRGVEI